MELIILYCIFIYFEGQMHNQSQIHRFVYLIRKKKVRDSQSKSRQDSGQNLPLNFSSLRSSAIRYFANNVQTQDGSLKLAHRQRTSLQVMPIRLKQQNYNFFQKKNSLQNYHKNLCFKKQLLRQMIEDEERQFKRCKFGANWEQNRVDKYSKVYYNSDAIQMQKQNQSHSNNASPNKHSKPSNRKVALCSQASSKRVKTNNIHRQLCQNQWPKIKNCRSIIHNNICYQPCYRIKKIYTQPAMIVRNQSKSISQNPQFQQKQAVEQMKLQPDPAPKCKKKSKKGARMLQKSNSKKNKGNLNTTFKVSGWDYRQCQPRLEDLYIRK